MFANRKQITEALNRLGRHLVQSGVLDEYNIVVCGGAALVYLEIIDRPTKDLDVLTLLAKGPDGKLAIDPRPELPEEIQLAAAVVAREFRLAPDWLNTGPSPLRRTTGFPAGFLERVRAQQFGPALRVHFLGRQDALALKLFAALDKQGGSRHLKDIEALRPSRKEIAFAVSWLLNRPTSPQFRSALEKMVRALGFKTPVKGARKQKITVKRAMIPKRKSEKSNKL